MSIVPAAVEPGVTVAGEKLYVAPAGRPVAVSVIALENPDAPGVNASVKLAAVPGTIEAEGVPPVAAIPKS